MSKPNGRLKAFQKILDMIEIDGKKLVGHPKFRF